jgi:hypothetical protein
MKQEDAKRQIILLWSKRDRDKLTQLDILGFYGNLEQNRPDLLYFKCSGDKYQIIKTWLNPYVVE